MENISDVLNRPFFENIVELTSHPEWKSLERYLNWRMEILDAQWKGLENEQQLWFAKGQWSVLSALAGLREYAKNNLDSEDSQGVH